MNQIPRGPLMAGRFIAGAVGLIFGGVGLTVLIFLWTASDGFDSPPLLFRIIGSFIALAFVVIGGTTAFAVWRSRGLSGDFDKLLSAAQTSRIGASAEMSNYTCPGCGATLAKNIDVSPLGDVKCTFCGRWFNVHKAA